MNSCALNELRDGRLSPERTFSAPVRMPPCVCVCDDAAFFLDAIHNLASSGTSGCSMRYFAEVLLTQHKEAR